MHFTPEHVPRYPVDSYDHVADVWFVSYDHITQVSQAHISKTNAQTNKARHAKPQPMTPLYCVQIREHSVAYKRHNRPCLNSPSPTSAILYDRNCYDRNCFPTVIYGTWASSELPRLIKRVKTTCMEIKEYMISVYMCVCVCECRVGYQGPFY